MTQDDYRIDSSGEHPTLEDLAAYHEGRLPLVEADRIRSHFVRCKACASVLLDLSEVADLDSDSTIVATKELGNSWARLHEAIAEEGLWPSIRADATKVWNSWKTLALAASVAAVLFGGTSSWLWHQLNARIPSQVDPPWISLAPEGDLRASGPEMYQELVLAPGVRGWISLAFSAPDTVVFLRVRFFPTSGSAAVWSWSGSRPKDPRILRMELTSQELSPGDYRIDLSGRSNSEDPFTPVAQYFLRVAERERP